MLVLTRKVQESIVVGRGEGKVTVTVVSVQGDKVRLGIDAPKEVPVHRREVYDIINGEEEEKG